MIVTDLAVVALSGEILLRGDEQVVYLSGLGEAELRRLLVAGTGVAGVLVVAGEHLRLRLAEAGVVA